MPSPFETAAENEEHVKVQLFCGLSRAIREFLFHSEDKPHRVLVEVPTGKGFADVVVTKLEGSEEFPIMIIECKRRILESLGRSFAEAASQSMKYALELNCPVFAIYDGSVFLIFTTDSPFLLHVCGIDYAEIASSDFCYQVLQRMMKKQYILGMIQQMLPGMSFPSPPDKALLKSTIFPVVARALVRKSYQHFGQQIEEEDVRKEADIILPNWHEALERR